MHKIVLASGSPRRREILEMLGLEFEVVESGFDEDLIPQEDAVEMVTELAIQKALSVAKKYPDSIVLGGDTTVEVDGEILGKAGSMDEAKIMFDKLLGKTHRVVTGVAVVNTLTGEQLVGSESGYVTFREGSEQELEQYVSKESNWQGFAGAYALQGGAAPFVLNQSGKLSAIIGLPVELTASLLEEMGVVVEVNPREVEDSLYGKKVGISE